MKTTLPQGYPGKEGRVETEYAKINHQTHHHQCRRNNKTTPQNKIRKPNNRDIPNSD
jgi:hypothetical protein